MCTKNEVPTFSGSKVNIWTDKHTDWQTYGLTDTQTWLKSLPTTYADDKKAQIYIKPS